MRISLRRVMLCVMLKGNVSFVVAVVVVVDDDGQRFRIYTYTYIHICMTYDNNLCDSKQTEQCHEAQRVVLFFWTDQACKMERA